MLAWELITRIHAMQICCSLEQQNNHPDLAQRFQVRHSVGIFLEGFCSIVGNDL